MARDEVRLLHSVDVVTAELACDLLRVRGLPCVLVPSGFDGVTIGHTPRDHAVCVPKELASAARECLVEAWGAEAVERLDSYARGHEWRGSGRDTAE